MKTIQIILQLFCCFLFFGCTEYKPKNNEADSKKEVALEIGIKDENYYRQKGYQVFPEFKLALNFPCLLEDVSMKTPGNNDLSLGCTVGNDVVYQVMIKKFPAGYRNTNKEEKQKIEDKFFAAFNLDKEYVIFNNIKAAVISYEHNGLMGKSLVFISGEQSFVFNLMCSDDINSRFNSMTNNIIFY